MNKLYDKSMQEALKVTAKHSFSKGDVKYKSWDGKSLMYEISREKDKHYWSLD